MANLTLAIPQSLRKKMKEHPEIRWSEVVRMEIQKKIEDLELMDRLTQRSRLSAKEALKISEKIDEDVARKLGLR
jgi:hypothetical protein